MLLSFWRSKGRTFDFAADRIIIGEQPPMVTVQPSGGGFGNTVQTADGWLVSAFSWREYTWQDYKPTHVEVVRWKLPPPAPTPAAKTDDGGAQAQPGVMPSPPPAGPVWQAVQRVCGSGWRGPSDDEQYTDGMLVSRSACNSCAQAHRTNLTASGATPAHVAALCATLPARWNPLAGLPKLAKIHHSEPLCEDNPTGAPSGCARNELIGVNEYLDSTDPMQLDMARITGAVPLSIAFGVPAGLYAGCSATSCWHNKSEVLEAVRLAQKSNASLGLYYAPW